MQDTSIIKEKILSAIRSEGPSLPVHISKKIEQSTLLTSAFLSELVSEKKLKITYMRVGSSPVYYLPEQKNQIEKYSHYLKSKEREAFDILKEKKIIKDSEQEPAIRVALRNLRDFAIPFKKNNEIYWRFFTIPEQEIPEQFKEKKKLDIFNKKEPAKKEPVKKRTRKKSSVSQTKNKKFFEKIKNYLNSKNIKINDIVGFSKNDLILKIKENEKEKLLIAFNKKTINEKDILKCYKKAKEEKLPYKIFSLGKQTKKITNLIEAIKALDNVEKIE